MWTFLLDAGLTPHGFCLLWEPGLIWLHAVADLLTGTAYFSIPLALAVTARRRRDMPFGTMFWLFAAFILACGATHFMAIVTLWTPAYLVEGLLKALAAVLSVVTACLLWPLLKSVERSEARYRLLTENATDVIYELDLSLRLTYMSPACLDMLGRSAGDILAMPDRALIHAEDRERVRAAYQSVAAGQGRTETLFRVRRRDGRWAWIEVTLRLVHDMRGRPSNILGIARDVSQRKVAEDLIRASEARYRLLAENMSDAVLCLDQYLRRSWASPSYFTLVGFEPRELTHETLATLAHPEDRPRIHARFAALLRGEDVHPTQYRIRRKDGRYIWVEAGGRLMSGRAGIIFSLRDVSLRKQAEDRLLAANAQLEKIARIDSLTGLANRRRFDEALAAEFRRCAGGDMPLSLILIDVDRFKAYNDQYGHPAGDACLAAIGAVVAATAQRLGDVAARYGGEELAIILPDTPNLDAVIVAERLWMAIRALRIAHAASATGMVTASFGVATIYPALGQDTAADLVNRADQLLYQAKSQGRDVVMAETHVV